MSLGVTSHKEEKAHPPCRRRSATAADSVGHSGANASGARSAPGSPETPVADRFHVEFMGTQISEYRP